MNMKSQKNVLIVDDERDFADLLAAMLHEEPVSAEIALDGEDAIRKLAARRPDLITLDIQMPRKTGIMFYRQVKSTPEYRSIPIVVVTGLTRDDPETRNFIRSFLEVEHLPHPEAYIEKPVQRAEFVALVRSTLAENPAREA